jgi:hypothetical protein
MATATDLISNRGDASLGLSNTAIPVTNSKDLDVINQTARDIYLNNTARNQQLFQRKLQDRDKLLAAIDSGDIPVPDILEEDTPIVKEGLEKLDKAFENRVKKGINDLDAAREYKKALQEAKFRTTQAAARKIFYDQESGAIGKETLPRKQEARKKNLEGVLKAGFYKDIVPYQQTQDLDIEGSILSTGANITEQFSDPKTLTKGKRTVFDYGKTLDNNKNNFLNDVNKRYDQEQLINSIQSLQPKQFQDTIASINNQIAGHNQQKGLIKGQAGYVDPVQVVVDPQTGQGMIQESLPDFAAKFTLANQKPLASIETVFDKDAANYALGKERNRIAGINAGANAMRARTYAAVQQKKLSQMDADEKQGNTIWSGWVDKITTKGGEPNDIVWAGDLPKGYTLIGGLDENGKPIELKPKIKESVDKDGKVIATSRYYQTRYKGSDGKDVQKDFLKDQYDDYKKLAKDKGYSADVYKDWLKGLIKDGAIEMEVVGENGTANFNTAFQTVRALSNKLSTKGEEPVFGTETVETETINE